MYFERDLCHPQFGEQKGANHTRFDLCLAMPLIMIQLLIACFDPLNHGYIITGIKDRLSHAITTIRHSIPTKCGNVLHY